MSLRNRISSLLCSFLPPTNLFLAAKVGNVDAIRKLVSNGADINAKRQSLNVEGATSLHLAAQYGQIKAIQELVKLGARINAKDNHGSTPLMYAVSKCSREVVVRTLLDLGADINFQDRYGKTALDLAAFNGDTRLVQMLLACGANPNQKRAEKESSPVANAAHSGNVEVLKILLAGKAAVSTPSYGGLVALSLAALDGNVQFVRLLLEAGADPNLQDRDKYTPLMCAVRGKNLKILLMLLEAGADINIENDEGETALDIAGDVGNKEIIELLIKAGSKHGSKIRKTTPSSN